MNAHPYDQQNLRSLVRNHPANLVAAKLLHRGPMDSPVMPLLQLVIERLEQTGPSELTDLAHLLTTESPDVVVSLLTIDPEEMEQQQQDGATVEEATQFQLDKILEQIQRSRNAEEAGRRLADNLEGNVASTM